MGVRNGILSASPRYGAGPKVDLTLYQPKQKALNIQKRHFFGWNSFESLALVEFPQKQQKPFTGEVLQINIF